MEAIDAHDQFFHVRIFLGMLVSLALAHMVHALSRVIDRRHRQPPYWVHLVWVAFLFLYLMHFWWWEMRLVHFADWQFQVFLLLALYALLLYFLSWTLLPDQVDPHSGYRERYYLRRNWFFGGLIAVFLIDIADTSLKGPELFVRLGTEYWIRNAGFIACSVIAMLTTNAKYHGTFAVAGLLYQAQWIARMYERIQ